MTMKVISLKGFTLTLLVLVVIAIIGALIVNRTPSLHTEGAVRDAVDAYIYGYPLVTFDMARKQQTNVETPDEQHAPMNQMIKMRTYLPIDNHCCAAPNADTLYTIAWLDVYDEPLILSIPEIKDRYYIVPLLDGYSEVIRVISSINDGSDARTLAITGPGWSGTLPEGVEEVKSTTAIVWLLGRIYSTGTPEDYKIVNDIQDQFELVPLSAYGKPYTPPAGEVDPDFDMITATRAQINSMDVYTYFNYLGRLLKTNPPKPEDAVMVEKLARIGVVPGQDFDASALQELDARAVGEVPAVAQGAIGLEIRSADDATRAMIAPINHVPTFHAIQAERAFLAYLDGSCRTPIAALAMHDETGALTLIGKVLSPDGKKIYDIRRSGSPKAPLDLGHTAGMDLRAEAGDQFFAEIVL